jgi:TolB-like protein
VHYFFGEYGLDTDRRELKRGSELISIGPQGFDVLHYLICNRERVVSKDNLIEAVWQGRIVSDSTLASQINAVRRSIGDSGEDRKLIRTIPRKGFRFVGHVREEQSSGASPMAKPRVLLGRVELEDAPTLPLPDKPSIAVLPFENLSGDPDQDYFADGIVEDITTALSRMRWLFVIARNSSFTYKGRAVDVKQVGRELGVRYVLEGSVRKAGNRVRIAGQLIDASTGAHLQADRFDGTLEDIFDLQDQMTTSVVSAIAPALEQAEIERAKSKPTESLDAYDYFLQGMASIYRWTRVSNDQALTLFYKAIQLDPDFATAHGMAAYCYVNRKLYGWLAADRDEEIGEAVRLAGLAVELGKDDAVALARGGHALGFLAGDVESAVTLVDRALWLNPNLAAAWNLSGWIRIFRGEPGPAIERFERAMRLSPLDPALFSMQNGVAIAHFLAGRYDDASLWAEKSFREQPKYLSASCVVAASHALAGRLDQTGPAMARLRKIDPTLRVSNIREWYPLRRPEDLTRLQHGLRRAGLPE